MTTETPNERLLHLIVAVCQCGRRFNGILVRPGLRPSCLPGKHLR